MRRREALAGGLTLVATRAGRAWAADAPAPAGPQAGMRATFDYLPARDGLALLTGGPAQAGYAASAAANPRLTWTPRFSDEAAPKGHGNIWNGEAQFYADPGYGWSNGFTPFAIVDGALRIRAQRVEGLGFAANEMPTDPLASAPYGFVSGVLTSRHRFSQQGGYFEIDAMMPKGPAVWPAFWLLPVNERHPPEIDVVEYLGHEPMQYRATLLTTRTIGNMSGEDASAIGAGVDLSAAFHRYGALWTDTEIRFYLDGKLVATKDIRGKPEFGQPFYLLVNLAIGSNKPRWVPPPSAGTPNPVDLVVRSVRAWQRLGPSSITLSSPFVREAAPAGTTVGTLACHGLGSITGVAYSIADDPGANGPGRVFEVSGNQLRTAAPLEFRRMPYHVVTIRAADDQGRTWQQPVSVAVLDSGLAPNVLTPGSARALDHPAWTQRGVVVRGVPRAGQQAADAIMAENPTMGPHALEQNVQGAGPGRRIVISADLRPNGRSWVNFEVFAMPDCVLQAFFDIAAGEIGDRFASSGQTGLRLNDCRIFTLGSGFYRCQVDFAAAASPFRLALKIVTSGSDYGHHPGDPAKGVVVRLPLRVVAIG